MTLTWRNIHKVQEFCEKRVALYKCITYSETYSDILPKQWCMERNTHTQQCLCKPTGVKIYTYRNSHFLLLSEIYYVLWVCGKVMVTLSNEVPNSFINHSLTYSSSKCTGMPCTCSGGRIQLLQINNTSFHL